MERTDLPDTRPIGIVAVCITGFILSALQIWSQIIPPHVGPPWQGLLLLNGLIYFVCWVGFWRMRRSMLPVLLINFVFTVTAYYMAAGIFFHPNYLFYIIAIIITFSYRHRLR
jgi:hypothetical protein